MACCETEPSSVTHEMGDCAEESRVHTAMVVMQTLHGRAIRSPQEDECYNLALKTLTLYLTTDACMKPEPTA